MQAPQPFLHAQLTKKKRRANSEMDHVHSTTHGRRETGAIEKGEGVEVMEDYNVTLRLTIHHAEGIDDPRTYPNVTKRKYRVLYWVEPEKDYFWTSAEEGFPNPVWNVTDCIPLGRPGDYSGFLNVEVVRLDSQTDPGTSTGLVLVGRARIPLPREINIQVAGKFVLVRNDGPTSKGEGLIAVTMNLMKTRGRRY